MASANESVIIYQTWFESAELLGKEKQIEAMMKIIRYGLYGEDPDYAGDKYLKAVMMTWIAQVDAQKKNRKGGAPKGNKNAVGNKGGTGRPKKTQPKNTTLNVNGNANGNSNANGNDNDQLPAAGTPAIEQAGGTSLGEEPDWMKEDE